MPVKNSGVHPSAYVGPFVKVHDRAWIGPNCYIDGRVTVGEGANLIAGVTFIGDAVIGEGCVVEPLVSMTSIHDALQSPPVALSLGASARIGAGSVLASGLSIGANAVIGPGTIVLRNVPPYAIVKGNPAAIVGYSTSVLPVRAKPTPPSLQPLQTIITDSAVKGVQTYKFPRIRDLRGDLAVGEFGRNVPFEPKRYFLVYDVPSAETRGEHAHRICKQFLIGVSGRVAVVVDDGVNREEFELSAPNFGLFVPPRIWALQYKYSPGAVLLVFASHYYEPSDYIRNYQEFMKECGVCL